MPSESPSSALVGNSSPDQGSFVWTETRLKKFKFWAPRFTASKDAIPRSCPDVSQRPPPEFPGLIGAVV